MALVGRSPERARLLFSGSLPAHEVEVTARDDRAVAALRRVRACAIAAIRDDRVLHFDAAPAPATRRMEARPPLRGTVGRVVGVLGPERWGLYTYGGRGTSDEYDTPDEAVRDLCRRLGPDRIGALHAGLRRAYADEIDTENEERERHEMLRQIEATRAAAAREVMRRFHLG